MPLATVPLRGPVGPSGGGSFMGITEITQVQSEEGSRDRNT